MTSPHVDRRHVFAFHLAVLEAIELSRRNGLHPVTLYRISQGEYGAVDTIHPPLGAETICRISAGTKSVTQARADESQGLNHCVWCSEPIERRVELSRMDAFCSDECEAKAGNPEKEGEAINVL